MTTHTKTKAGGCSECGAEPAEVQAYLECSAVARALHARGRTIKVFPLAAFFGLAGQPVNAVAMRVLSIGDEGQALDAAHKTRSEQSRRAGEGKDAAKADANSFAAEQNLEALFQICRAVDDNGQPTPWAAFPGVGWMRRELSTDQIGCLLALYDELKRKHGPHPLEIDPETVEVIAKLLHEHAGDDIPEGFLSPYPRVFLTHLCVLLACRLGEAKRAVDVLLSEKEEWEAMAAERLAERPDDSDAASGSELTGR